MTPTRFLVRTGAALTMAAALACSDSTIPSLNGSNGTVVVKLTDAPFLADSVKSVDVFVVEVDGRPASTDDTDANANVDNPSAGGWTMLATPNQSYDLLSLQNGASVSLGSGGLAAGTYDGFRLIIDQDKSSVTLKNGMVLTGTSSPGVKFPSAGKSGLKINLSKPLIIVGGATTTLLVDFDVNDSFVQRGNSIQQNGLLFKPVINATIIDAATVNANVRLANATDAGLDLLQGTSVVSGGTAVAFGHASSCASVTAASPNLSIAPTGTTTALPGFTPTLVAGNSYIFVAFPGAGSATNFATLVNTFTPTAGQAGLRVFNATGGATGLDAFVTTLGGPLTTATISNAVSGTATAFVSVPAGSEQIRLTSTGLLTVLLDVGAQTLTAGTNYTLIVAPPASGSATLRAFIVPAC